MPRKKETYEGDIEIVYRDDEYTKWCWDQVLLLLISKDKGINMTEFSSAFESPHPHDVQGSQSADKT